MDLLLAAFYPSVCYSVSFDCHSAQLASSFNFLIATYFSKAQYSRFVLKVPLNPNQ